MSTIRHIRKAVFNVTQAEFAKIAGVTQATVSRWESGVSPTIQDLEPVRRAAVEQGLPWRDEWFFDPPQDALPTAAKEDAA